MVCKNCGSENEDGAKRCVNCDNALSQQDEKKSGIKKRVWIPAITGIIVLIMAVSIFFVSSVTQKKTLNKMLTDGSWVNISNSQNMTALKFENNQLVYKTFHFGDGGVEGEGEEKRFAYKVQSSDRFSINSKSYKVIVSGDGIEIFPAITDEEKGSEKWLHIKE